MTHNTCDGVIAELAEWVDGLHQDSADLVAMIATNSSREEAAETILRIYGVMSVPSELFSMLVDPGEKSDAVRLSALREALGCLARDKYKEEVAIFHIARESERISTLSNMEGVMA